MSDASGARRAAAAESDENENKKTPKKKKEKFACEMRSTEEDGSADSDGTSLRRFFFLFRPRKSGRRTLSPASVLNSARFASATTAEIAMTTMNTEVNTRHGRSCDQREYFARKSARARGVASFRLRASSSPFHANRARGVSDSPDAADEAGMPSGDLETHARASRWVEAWRAGGNAEAAGGRLVRSTPTRRARRI